MANLGSLLAALLGAFFPLAAAVVGSLIPAPKVPKKAPRRTLSWIVLAMALGLTLAAWHFVRSRARGSLESRFSTRVELLHEALRARAGSYEAAMRASAAFVSASDDVAPQEWAQFVYSLRVPQMCPGLTRLAFVTRRAGHDTALGGPVEEPASAGSQQPGQLIVRLIAPAGPSPQADLTSPEYLQAAERAEKSGRTTVSEYQPADSGGNVESALFVPVYAPPGAAALEQPGHEVLVGWVVAWFQPKILLAVPRYPLGQDIDLEVFAGEDARDSHLLYDRDESQRLTAGDGTFIKQTTRPVEMFGRSWTLAVGAKPAFVGTEADAATLVFAAGLVASLVLFLVTDSLASSRMRAVAGAKLMTERLRQSEAFSRAVIENAPVGILTVSSNRSIETVNSAAARMFGYRGHELAGCLFEELLADPGRFRSKGFADFAAFRKETGRRADGTAFPIEVSAWPMHQGERPMHTAIVVDVTERLQAAEALRAERDFSAAVLNVAPVLVVVVDPDGHIVSFNRACEETTGYRFDEVRGRGFLELFVPTEERHESQRVAAELCSGLYPNQHENHWLTKDGRLRLISWSNTALRDAHGSMRFLIGCGMDVTEQREAQKERDRYVIELERAQHTTERQAEMLARQADELAAARDAALESAQLKSQFLANMSHEIRTPMSGVLGMTHLLANTPLSEEQHDYVATIRGSAEALLVILNDVLDFSKIEAGKLRFETLDFNLAKTVEGTVQLLRLQATTKGIELKSSIAEGVPTWVRGDPGRLRQVLVNLIGNAIKFTERGHVEVAVDIQDPSQEPFELSFSVRDTGIGISPEARKNLFRAFVQADGSTSRKHGGTGLGLAISQQLVHRMGGEIGCESVSGQGSQFWFTVKLGMPNASSVPRLKELRALVVADQQADRDGLHRALDSWGIEASIAASWSEALQLLSQADAEARGFATVVVQTQAVQQFAGFVDAVRASPRIAGVEILAWGPDRLEPRLARLRDLGVKVEPRSIVAASDLFNALVEVASARDAATGPSQAETAAPNRSDSPATPSNGRRVLVVEDNLVNQKVASRMLRNLGYEAQVAGNGVEALKALDRARYDLILMDCQMPEMDGYQATAEIRRRESGQQRIPIVALTAHAMQGDREKCLNAGMDDYLSKPIDPKALTSVLRRWGLTSGNDDAETVEAGKRTH